MKGPQDRRDEDHVGDEDDEEHYEHLEHLGSHSGKV